MSRSRMNKLLWVFMYTLFCCQGVFAQQQAYYPQQLTRQPNQQPQINPEQLPPSSQQLTRQPNQQQPQIKPEQFPPSPQQLTRQPNEQLPASQFTRSPRQLTPQPTPPEPEPAPQPQSLKTLVSQTPGQRLPLGQSEMSSAVPYYAEPGITGFQNGRWVGSDHLFNLQKDIGILIEVLQVTGDKSFVDIKEIERSIMSLFKEAGLNPYLLEGGPKPPFPFYHILLISMPIPDGKVVLVDERLIEEVHLDRVKLAEGVRWQAITWERQTLVQAAKEAIQGVVFKNVIQLAQEFIERYKYYENVQQRYE